MSRGLDSPEWLPNARGVQARMPFDDEISVTRQRRPVAIDRRFLFVCRRFGLDFRQDRVRRGSAARTPGTPLAATPRIAQSTASPAREAEVRR